MAGAASGGASAGAVKAGNAFVEIGARSTGIEKELNKLKKGFTNVGEHVMKTGLVVAAGGGAIFAGMTGLMEAAISRGVEAQRAADRLGTTTESISALGYAASLTGGDMESLEGAIRHMQVSISKVEDDGGVAANALARIGLDADNLIKLDLDSQLDKIADAMERVKFQSDKMNATRDIFGRGGAGMINMLQGGAAGLQAKRDDALKNGGVVTAEVAEKAEIAERAFKRLRLAVVNTGLAIGEALLPLKNGVSEGIEKIVSIGGTVRTWIHDNEELFGTIKMVALGVTGVGFAIAGLGAGIIGIGAVFGGLATAIGAVGSVLTFALSPLGLFVGGLAGITGAVASAMSAAGSFDSIIGTLSTTFGGAWSGIKDAIAGNDLSSAMKIAVTGMKLAFSQGIDELNLIWIDFKFGVGNVFNDIIVMAQKMFAQLQYGHLEKGGVLDSIRGGLGDIGIAAALGVNGLFGDEASQRRLLDDYNARERQHQEELKKTDPAYAARIAEIDADAAAKRARRDAENKAERDAKRALQNAASAPEQDALKGDLRQQQFDAEAKADLARDNATIAAADREDKLRAAAAAAMDPSKAFGDVKGAFAGSFDTRSFAFGDKTKQMLEYQRRTADATEEIAQKPGVGAGA